MVRGLGHKETLRETKKPARSPRSHRPLVAPAEEGDREPASPPRLGHEEADVVAPAVHHQLAVIDAGGDPPAVQVAAVPAGLLPPRLRVAEVVHRHVPAAGQPHGLGDRDELTKDVHDSDGDDRCAAILEQALLECKRDVGFRVCGVRVVLLQPEALLGDHRVGLAGVLPPRGGRCQEPVDHEEEEQNRRGTHHHHLPLSIALPSHSPPGSVRHHTCRCGDRPEYIRAARHGSSKADPARATPRRRIYPAAGGMIPSPRGAGGGASSSASSAAPKPPDASPPERGSAPLSAWSRKSSSERKGRSCCRCVARKTRISARCSPGLASAPGTVPWTIACSSRREAASIRRPAGRQRVHATPPAVVSKRTGSAAASGRSQTMQWSVCGSYPRSETSVQAPVSAAASAPSASAAAAIAPRAAGSVS